MSLAQRHVLTDAERVDWLRLCRTPRVGPITFYSLLTQFGSASEALDCLPRLTARSGSGGVSIPTIPDTEAEIARARRQGLHLVASCEPDYPPALAAIEDAPPVITAGRDLSLLQKPSIAIVGARNASTNGRRIAEKLARDLSDAGLVVVSGLARGIDTAAHRASLEQGTVAVLAGGADMVYPPENSELQAAIFDKGCIVTEAPLGTEPVARHFPRRNRIISGLVPGVIVIEAARHSGSLITARMALEQGREVFAVPGSPLDPRSQGTNNLIREGAVLTESADDVLRALPRLQSRPLGEGESGIEWLASPSPEPGDSEMDAARRTVLEALGPSPVAVDELARDCQVSLPIMLTILLELELSGRLERQAGQRVSLIR